jgi:hypothetical protein
MPTLLTACVTLAPNDGGLDAASDGDAEAGPTVNPACTVPAAPASNGACITLTGDGGIECNPVTNVPCNVGESCDNAQNGFHCYAPPPPNTAALCTVCDDELGPACGPGSTCVHTATGLACGRFCCTDGDCTPGHCDTTTLGSGPIGVCVN